MTTITAKLRSTLPARLAQLQRRRHKLAEQIDAELQRPAPCSVTLQQLKRQRLRLKDQITWYTALIRSPDRARMPVVAVS